VLAKLAAQIEKAPKGAIIMGVRNLNTATKRRTKLGLELEQSAKEIVAHLKGDVRLPTRRIVLSDEVDVKRIRTKAKMSQAQPITPAGHSLHANRSSTK
jgi:hypothetical protein